MFPSFPDSEQIKQLEEKWLRNPRSRIFAQLADFYRKSGRAEEGIDICLEGLEYLQDYPQGYLVLGKCYLEMERYGEAETAFQQALERDHTNLVALKLLGQVRERRGDLKEALNNYSDYLDLNPFDTVILNRRETLLSAVPGGAAKGNSVQDNDDTPGDESSLEKPESVTVDETIQSVEARKIRRERDLAAGETEISTPGAPGLKGSISNEEDITPAAEPFEGDHREMPDGDPEQDIIVTMTLAKIFYKQGLYKRAREIYRRLLKKDPGNAVLNEKIAEIDACISSKHPSGGMVSREEAPEGFSKNNRLQGIIEPLIHEFPSNVRHVGDEPIIRSGETDSINNDGAIAMESFIETLDGEDAADEITEDEDLTFLPPETVIGKEYERFNLDETGDISEADEIFEDRFSDAESIQSSQIREDPEVVDFERWIRYIQF